MLKGIPKNLSPELVKVLMEMGHGDEILLADANYPAKTNNQTVVRADGINVPELLASILKLMPLDTYSDYQAILMEVVKGDDTKPIIWDEYKKIIADNFDKPNIKEMER